MSNAQGIGAPKGGRLHWFLLNLPLSVRVNYVASYDYLYHNYMLIRKHEHYSKKSFHETDYFIIVRTSKRCFRVTGHNITSGQTVYKSFKSSQAVADYIGTISEDWQKERNKNDKK